MTLTIEILNTEYVSHLSMVKLILDEIFFVNESAEIVASIDQYCRSLPCEGMFDILHHDPYDVAVEWGQTGEHATDETFARYEALLDERSGGR